MNTDFIFDMAQSFCDNGEYAQALRLYEEAAENGNADAMFALGVMYLAGEGVRIDVELAREYIAKAKMHGHPIALFYLDIIKCYSQEDFEADNTDY